MPSRYSAALLGLGNIAWRFDANAAPGPARTHLAALRKHGNIDVLCGYSPVESDRRDFAQASGLRACGDIDDVWASKPDLVSICSPSEVHFEQAVACVDHAVPLVWLEKPPTLTLPDLDSLIRRAEDQGRTKFLVNYMRRYSATYQRLAQVYGDGSLGSPLAMQVLYSRGLETNGSHFLDVLMLIRGDEAEPELTIADAERGRPSPSFMLRFPDGFVVSFSGHESSFHINDVILTCEEGRVSVLSGGMDVRLERKTSNEMFPGFWRLVTADNLLFGSVEEDPFSAALGDLLDSHACNREPVSNLRTARRTQSVIHQIRNPA